MRTPTRLLAVVLAAAACSERATAPADPLPPAGLPVRAAPPMAAGTLRVVDQAGRTGPVRLADLDHLQADASYSGAPGSHAFRLDVTGPSGTLYTQVSGTAEAGADGRATSASRLEVRGTPIDAYHMTGAWKFVLVVDGSPLASAAIDVTE